MRCRHGSPRIGRRYLFLSDPRKSAPATHPGLSVGHFFPGVRMSRRPLLVALATAAAAWLYHFDAPLLDGMSIKQVFIAHKARVIAGPPFDPARTSFDFLDDDGRRLELTEEVPLYTGLLGLAYRLCDEREWLGRVLSIMASLVALLAVHDLTRRTFDRPTARVATALFAVCPLLLFYGRAVQPDACMLAGMLACAAC